MSCGFWFFCKKLTVVITNVLVKLEDKILISAQSEATVIYSVLSSSSVERYVIQHQKTSLNKKGVIVGKPENEIAQVGGVRGSALKH